MSRTLLALPLMPENATSEPVSAGYLVANILYREHNPGRRSDCWVTGWKWTRLRLQPRSVRRQVEIDGDWIIRGGSRWCSNKAKFPCRVFLYFISNFSAQIAVPFAVPRVKWCVYNRKMYAVARNLIPNYRKKRVYTNLPSVRYFSSRMTYFHGGFVLVIRSPRYVCSS